MADPVVQGIMQGDVLIRAAISEGLKDLRRNAWLLDYVFASLKHDTLTNSKYGQASITDAKNWFIATNIDVRMDAMLEGIKYPCITIALNSSDEIDPETTLGDIHHDTVEDATEVGAPETDIVSAFTPISYDATTGIMVLPTGSATGVFPDMVVVDASGTEHVIDDVLDADTIILTIGTVADFKGAVIRSPTPGRQVTVESTVFRETYLISCNVNTEPQHLLYLYSVIKFILLRYREAYLEARGFERSRISATDFKRDPMYSEAEGTYHRFFSLSGVIRDIWPKYVLPKIQGVNVVMTIDGLDTVAPEADPDDVLWRGESDGS